MDMIHLGLSCSLAWFVGSFAGQTMHVGGGEKKPASMKMDDCEDEMEGEVEGEVEGESTWNDEDEKEFNKLKQRKMHTMKAVPH